MRLTAPGFASLTFLFASVLISSTYAQIATVTATKEQVQEFTGTGNVKLVFINGTGADPTAFSFCFIDYSATTSGLPSVQVITGAQGGILPTISPDGQYIVYEKGPAYDHQPQASAVYMTTFSAAAPQITVASATAYQPRFVYNTTNPTVIYGTVDGTNTWNGQGQTVKREVVGGVAQAEQVVWAGGSYVGGLSPDGRYLCTGFQEARMMDLNNPSVAPRRIHVVTFRNTATGIDTVCSLQVCNSSTTPSTLAAYTNTMMYLDFGYPFFTLSHTTAEMPAWWDIHEAFIIGNYENHVLKYYMAPEKAVCAESIGVSKVAWDDPEWSNHPYFAAASMHVTRKRLAGGTNNREAVYLVDLREDQKYLRLIEAPVVGTASTSNFMWPWVWVEKPAGFTEEAGWLDATAVRFPARYSSGGILRLAIDGERLVSNLPLQSAAIFDLIGNRLTQVRFPAAAGSARLPRMSSGTYFVKVRSISGESMTVRWTVSR